MVPSARLGPAIPLRALSLGAAAALIVGVLMPLAHGRAATGDPVLINEVLISHLGTPDDTEFAELYGTPGASLAGLSLLVVEGDSNTGPGTVDQRLDFGAGAHLGGNGFYLVGNPAGLGTHYGVTPDVSIGNDWFENGSQTIALVETAGAPAAGATVTGSETVLDAVGFTDAGPTDAWFFSAPVVGPDDGFLPAGAHRASDGVDTDTAADWVLADYQLGPTNTPTAASPYDAPPTADCGAPVSTDAGTAVLTTVSAADPDGRVVGFGITSAPDPGSVTLGVVSPASTVGATATAQVGVGATTPAGTYDVTVTAWTDGTPVQQAQCDLTVTVRQPPAGVPSLDALKALLGGSVANGDVAPSKAHLLTARLARVERFLTRGQTQAAMAQLRAFANQVRGLSPRWVKPSAAAALTRAANALRSQH
jgi:FIMAH domain